MEVYIGTRYGYYKIKRNVQFCGTSFIGSKADCGLSNINLPNTRCTDKITHSLVQKMGNCCKPETGYMIPKNQVKKKKKKVLRT